jgi:hypothetical protein
MVDGLVEGRRLRWFSKERNDTEDAEGFVDFPSDEHPCLEALVIFSAMSSIKT